MIVCVCVLKPPRVLGFAQAVWNCEQESSVKDTIRQGVKGRGGEEWMAGRAGEDVLEGKERNQT